MVRYKESFNPVELKQYQEKYKAAKISYLKRKLDQLTKANFGVSVSSGGDINGDGFSDVIVGAHNNNSYTGSAYIFFGSTYINNIIDITMSGEASNNSFGYSASSAGDVNGDGYSDIIAGAYGYSSSTGRAYIYTGSAISIKPVFELCKGCSE